MGLNRNEPIPETYDELQGLRYIEEAFYKRTPSFAADQFGLLPKNWSIRYESL